MWDQDLNHVSIAHLLTFSQPSWEALPYQEFLGVFMKMRVEGRGREENKPDSRETGKQFCLPEMDR